MPFIIIPIAIA